MDDGRKAVPIMTGKKNSFATNSAFSSVEPKDETRPLLSPRTGQRDAMPTEGNESGVTGCEEAWTGHAPTIRLHLWLETPDGIFFGVGRALLLAKIEEHGSLSKAAEALGMSYRAAWGKIRRTEKVLGVKLIVQNGCKKGGHRLTEQGLLFKEKYLLWFQEIEKWALIKAREIFPWPVKSFKTKTFGRILQFLIALTLSCSPLEDLIEVLV
jgi:molybdate transport system regulatory protein